MSLCHLGVRGILSSTTSGTLHFSRAACFGGILIPEAKLYRKAHGQEAKLGYLGHVLMENRNGMIVDAMVTQADGRAERDAAVLMLYRKWRNRRQRANAG